METLYRIRAALNYFFRAHYRMGHHIHSPYCYHIAVDVLFESNPYYSYQQIEDIRAKMLRCNDKLLLKALGTSSARETTVAKEQKNSQKTAKYGQLLQRLCAENKAKTIVELGTNCGVTTLYLSANDSKSGVYTFEGQRDLVRVAQSNFSALKRKNITLIEGDIDVKFPQLIEKVDDIDILFVDANHTYNATMNYYQLAKTKKNAHSIFIFDDIHWSKEMEQAWNEIRQDEDVTLSIDLYFLGIIWFNKELPKQHYIIAF